MDNIYKLEGRAAEIAARYQEVMTEFEDLMEENGGELNEESQEYIDKLEELQGIQAELRENFEKFPDAYAAWYKNVEAEKKVAEAEMKAFKEMQDKALAKYKAKVNNLDSRLEWIRQNIAESMRLLGVEKLDKKRSPDALFSIYFQESKSIEVDETLALAQYQERIDEFFATLPEWLPFVLKIDKNVLKKVDDLPRGFERIISKNLQIR